MVPQLVGPGEIGSRPVLPSFLYIPTAEEGSSLTEPWDTHAAAEHVVAGEFARDHGGLTPARQIASAKSWLANASVDRTARILPWGAEGAARFSPVEASAHLLGHLRDVWNFERAGAAGGLRLEQHQIVLTVPASFDEEARELTVQAARDAGFSNVRLLEEPLAAVYAWISAHRRAVADYLHEGELVLVCDVGGGTTDFTLVRVSTGGGALTLERTAVGEHLLLGGDNLDLALAVLIEDRLLQAGGTRLSLTQRQALRRKCSTAKEHLLSSSDDGVRISIGGAGRGVVGGAMSAEITRRDVLQVLSEGFLPLTAPDDLPARDRRPGLRELGLPYESEPAITKHLAAFLWKAARAAGRDALAQPDVVLFNGGFFAPPFARERVLDVLGAWLGRRPRVLENARPEMAVAAGAAFYGRLLNDPEAAARLLIRAGSARAYYVGVAGEGSPPSAASALAVCVIPRGTQEGTTYSLDHEFAISVNQPLAFPLYSTTQRFDAVDAVVRLGEGDDLHAHAPLVASFRYGKRSRKVDLRVRLEAAFTETGTLELWCQSTSTDHRWRLAFNLRKAESDPFEEADSSEAERGRQTDAQVVVDEAAVESAAALIRETFGSPNPRLPSEALTGELENRLGYGKHAWPLPVLRKLADALLSVEAGRRVGSALEIRWLNLAGFCARPGFGTLLDEWRISELRKVYAAGLTYPRDVQCQVEWLVLWQRVSAGFSTGQQRELAQRVSAQLGVGQRKPLHINPQVEREGWRLLGSLERLDSGLRTKLGEELLERVKREPRNATWLWALGRLGARSPLYGPLSSVVPAAVGERWIARLMELRAFTEEVATAIAQIGTFTGDRVRDLTGEARHAAAERIRSHGYPQQLADALLRVHVADAAETSRAFGEPLPAGLRLQPLATVEPGA
jgi:molecular chaperone DnaK (HSP70)